MSVLGIANDFQGNWTLRDGEAVSAMRGRTVPADLLIEKLLAERAAGRRDDRLSRGTVNPLEKPETIGRNARAQAHTLPLGKQTPGE